MRSARTRPARWIAACALAVVALAAPARTLAQKDDVAEADRLEKEVERLDEEDQLDRALEVARKVVSLREKALPAGDARIATALADVASLLMTSRDDLVESEKLLDRAGSIARAANDDKRYAYVLHATAWLLVRKGRAADARKLVDDAVARQEKAGPTDSELGTYLRSQATLAGRDVARVEPLLVRARAIHEKAGRKKDAIDDLLALQDLYRANGLATRQVEIVDELEKAIDAGFPKSKPSLVRAQFLVTLARFNRSQNSEKWQATAASQCAEALAIYEKLVAPGSLRIADTLGECALAEAGRGQMAAATKLRARANDLQEAYLKLILAIGSEPEKRAFAELIDRDTETTVSSAAWSFYADPKTMAADKRAAHRLALTTLLRRKGRVLDALSGGVSKLRAHLDAGDRAALDALAAARSELASAVVRGRGDEAPDAWRARVTDLEKKAGALEAAASARSAALASEERPVTIEDVQAKLPPGSALVEIYRYRAIDARAFNESQRWREPRYIAYLLPHEGEFSWVTIAERAQTVDDVVDQFRKVVPNADAKPRDLGDVTGRLFAIVWGHVEEPLRAMGAKRVFVSPDGALNLVPFGALLTHESHFLLEDVAISYVSSGRDLLRAPSPPAGAPPLLVVAPDYDAGGGAAAPATAGSRGGDLSRAHFGALPGTRAEGDAIRPLLRGAKLLSGNDASEAALKAVHAPSVLHVATHGFFLSASGGGGRGKRGLELDDAPKPAAPPEPGARVDPLLRSGLALAGANVRRGGDDDGILTALETSTLDLLGTRLVVLSACETGLGDVGGSGEGVYGLRRALVVAGSETQIMSLWKVDDQATKDLMIDFYRRLAAGEGRADALRGAQLAMADKKGTEAPYYWAAFILSGASGPLEGVASASGPAAAGDPGKVAPGARGCACRAAGERGEAPWAGLALIALVGLSRGAAAARRRGRRASRGPR